MRSVLRVAIVAATAALCALSIVPAASAARPITLTLFDERNWEGHHTCPDGAGTCTTGANTFYFTIRIADLRPRSFPITVGWRLADGSAVAGQDFTGLLLDNAIAISMDGKGAWRDNVFVERLWRSVKYERSICGPTTASARRALRSAGIWISTTASARIRALTLARRTTPTSDICRRSRQHEFRSRFRGVTLVGLRPPGMPPRKRHTPTQPAEVPLSQSGNLSRRSRPPLTVRSSILLCRF